MLRLVGAILAEQLDDRQTLDRREFAMTRATIFDFEQLNTFELEAAKHEAHRRGPRRN